MATYITLMKFTQKGAENIRGGPARLDKAKKLFSSMGAEIKAFYLVMGSYDAISITEEPDDTTAAKIRLAIGSQGNVSTETLRAFTEEEYRDIIKGIPNN